MATRAFCMAGLHGWSPREIGHALGVTDGEAMHMALEGASLRYEVAMRSAVQAERRRHLPLILRRTA